MVDGIVEQPDPHIAIEFWGIEAVGLPEGFDFVIAVFWICNANSAEQFVEIDIGKGEGSLFNMSTPHLCAPRKVATQLAIAHGIVGGEECLEHAVVGAVVLKVSHDKSLTIEELGISKPASTPAVFAFLPAGNSTHPLVFVGQIRVHLSCSSKNGFVFVDALREVRVCAVAFARRDVANDFVDIDVCHRASSHALHSMN